MLVLRSVGLGVVAVSMLACGSAASSDQNSASKKESVGTSRSAIQGGVLDTKSSFAVAIRLERGLCSGTLIAPNLVLTARHCTEQTPSRRSDGCEDQALLDPSQIYVTTNAEPLESMSFEDWTPVSKIMVGPKKNG